jgi:SAM-dependent methyltransferase
VQLESVDCPICGRDDAQEYLHVRDHNLFCPGEFRLVRCRGCGLVYLNPRPTREAMASCYPPEYWAAPSPGRERLRWDGVARRAVALLQRQYPGGRVLDVGCGVGWTVALLRELGFSAVGLEPAPHAAQIARDHYGVEVITAVLQEAPLPEAAFDAVILFDVLEHVHDPIGDLRSIHYVLRPGGAVVIKVPNLAAWQAHLLGKWWYALDPPRHLFHFSAGPLRRLLEKAGFGRVWCRALPDRLGALVFETSVIYWLRALGWARRGVHVAPGPGESLAQALEGKVYPQVPGGAKRMFRWLVRHVLYAPLALENLLGGAVQLLAVAYKQG